MKTRAFRSTSLLIVVLAASLAPLSAQPAANRKDNWVPTWATSQQLVRVLPQGRGGTPPPAATSPTPQSAQPTATPTPPTAQPPTPTTATPTTPTPSVPTPSAAAPTPAPTPLPPVQTFTNQTVRMILRSSIGGRRARVKLANAFNGTAVEIGAAHIALRDKDSGIAAGSDRVLTFGGRQTITMAPGMVVVSDPVDLAIAPLSDVAVSLYFPKDTGAPTTHANGLRPTYISREGDFSASPTIPDATTRMSYYWLAAVEVDAPPGTPLIVAFGDSITDGSRSTPDTHNTWPAILATRLAADKATAHMAIVNQGIGGNRVLTDGANFAGVNALARLDRDVLSQPGVQWLMMLEGVNDIGNSTAQANNPNPLTAEDLIWGLRQVVERAHQRGIKVIGCTILPYEGAGYFREAGETIRQAVNEWIRTSGVYDAVVDFDKATRDPANPRRLRPEFDPGDHLHPNDAGYRAMADAVDLRIFSPKAKAPAGWKP
jgi:lysophospholipase L1-like esterase